MVIVIIITIINSIGIVVVYYFLKVLAAKWIGTCCIQKKLHDICEFARFYLTTSYGKFRRDATECTHIHISVTKSNYNDTLFSLLTSNL